MPRRLYLQPAFVAPGGVGLGTTVEVRGGARRDRTANGGTNVSVIVIRVCGPTVERMCVRGFVRAAGANGGTNVCVLRVCVHASVCRDASPRQSRRSTTNTRDTSASKRASKRRTPRFSRPAPPRPSLTAARTRDAPLASRASLLMPRSPLLPAPHSSPRAHPVHPGRSCAASRRRAAQTM